MINVRRQWTRLKELKPPKAGSRRAVPISDDLVRLLLEHKMAAVDKTGPVFASRAGGRLSHRNVERRGFDPAATDAGLEGVTFDDLRHAYGSRLASKGLTARAIADAMGHKRTATPKQRLGEARRKPRSRFTRGRSLVRSEVRPLRSLRCGSRRDGAGGEIL